MYRTIFFCALALSAVLQGLRAWSIHLLDIEQWGDQIGYVLSGDPRQYDFFAAYGHPGGTIVEGGIAFRTLLGLPHETSVLIFLVLAQSVAVACICVICYALTKEHLWWLVTLVTLSINRLNEYATPASSLAAVLFVLLFMFTLYLYEKREAASTKMIILWAAIAGVLISTRVDIGIIGTAVCFLFLRSAGRFLPHKTPVALGATLVVFAASDPFMWYMPVQHLQDLLTKIFIHYGYFYSPLGIDPVVIAAISSLACITIILGIIGILSRTKKLSPIPAPFFMVALLLTAFLYLVFLTSSYSAPRYLLPILFLWETLLPPYLFALAGTVHIRTSSNLRSALRYGFAGALIAYQIVFFLIALYFVMYLPLQ